MVSVTWRSYIAKPARYALEDAAALGCALRSDLTLP